MSFSRFFFFFFNDPATTEIYTLSLHDALPICPCLQRGRGASAADVPAHREARGGRIRPVRRGSAAGAGDRKSTRLNSSHVEISYAVFCLKKKKKTENECTRSRRMPSPRPPRMI